MEAGPGSSLDTPPRPVSRGTLSVCSVHLRTTNHLRLTLYQLHGPSLPAPGVWTGPVRVLCVMPGLWAWSLRPCVHLITAHLL